MNDTQLKSLVKTSLRVVSTAFDDEIDFLISAGKTDITQATDAPFDINDDVQVNAVVLYVSGYFGDGDEDQLKRYEQVKQSIGLRKIKQVT